MSRKVLRPVCFGSKLSFGISSDYKVQGSHDTEKRPGSCELPSLRRAFLLDIWYWVFLSQPCRGWGKCLPLVPHSSSSNQLKVAKNRKKKTSNKKSKLSFFLIAKISLFYGVERKVEQESSTTCCFVSFFSFLKKKTFFSTVLANFLQIVLRKMSQREKQWFSDFTSEETTIWERERKICYACTSDIIFLILNEVVERFVCALKIYMKRKRFGLMFF